MIRGLYMVNPVSDDVLPGMRSSHTTNYRKRVGEDSEPPNYTLDLPRRMVTVPINSTTADIEKAQLEHQQRETDKVTIASSGIGWYPDMKFVVEESVPIPPDMKKHTSLIERELARLRDPNYTGVVDNAVDGRYP